MKIVIAGTGYVGLSVAMLLAQHNEVVALDNVADRVTLLNRKQPQIEDVEIREFLAYKKNFRATFKKNDAYEGPGFVSGASPKDCDSETNHFNMPADLTEVADNIYTRDLCGGDA